MTPLDAYFAATTQDAIDAAEAAVLASSSGVVTSPLTVGVRRLDSTMRWYGDLARAVGGLCCERLFGSPDLSITDEPPFAHLAFACGVPHPGGVTRIIPVLPLAFRRPVAADDVVGESAANLLYRQLWTASYVIERLVEGASDSDTLAEMIVSAGNALRALHAGWESHPWPPSRTWSAWQIGDELPPQELAPHAQRPPFDSAGVRGLRIFSDGTGVIAFARAIVRFRARDGRVLRVTPCSGEYTAAPTREHALITAFAPTGRMLDIPGYEDRPDERERMFALDLDTGRWTSHPESVPGVWFDESMERSMLRDSNGRSLRLAVADYPTICEYSPDHRLIWVADKHGGGGVFRLRDGALVRPLSSPLDEYASLRHVDVEGKTTIKRRHRSPRGHTAVAFARLHDRWCTFCDGIVTEDGVPRLAFGGASKIATFGDDQLLWLADGKEVRAIDWRSAAIKHRWPYEPLRKAAKAPARSAALARERRAMK